MKAVIAHLGKLAVEDVPTPEPGPGQLLLAVTRCGICGSDLHALRHGDELAEVLQMCGYDRYMRSDQKVVMGHEFTGHIIARGPETSERLKMGAPVVAVPLVRRGWNVDGVGLSASAPGAYAEQVVVQESLTMAVPNGLSLNLAAVTEPMAVGWHAVARANVKRRDTAVVLGCGPVGLAVIAALKARGVSTVIASDFAPGRRALATACGADMVVDPVAQSPYEAMADTATGFHDTMTGEYSAGIDAMDALTALPVPWWQVWGTLNALGKTTPAAPIIFECVGIPGMIDSVLAQAPLHSRVVVVGVCMGQDHIRPSLAINKEVDLRFVVGYSPLEFRNTLVAIADGRLNAAPLITGVVGLDGVAAAFEELGHPDRHAKILIDPSRAGTTISQPAGTDD